MELRLEASGTEYMKLKECSCRLARALITFCSSPASPADVTACLNRSYGRPTDTGRVRDRVGRVDANDPSIYSETIAAEALGQHIREQRTGVNRELLSPLVAANERPAFSSAIKAC